MSIRVGMVGVGAFAQAFIPLFKAHPLVDEIVLCDVDAKKLAANAAQWGVARTCGSLDELCRMRDIDAAAIITQNWLHAPQAAQALEAGKHVYSAVPTGITVEEIARLVETVARTGLVYALGETSYYCPETLYCRRRFVEGAFGHVVYGEGEYHHDWDHGLYDVMKWRGGDRWRETAGSPPMHYPTHSTSMIVSVTGAHMTHVSCQGFVDRKDDGLYGRGANIWDNPFSDESALFRMSDGSACRINEFRRIGHPSTVRMCLFGTEGSFEENTVGAMWMTKDWDARERLDDFLRCGDLRTERGTYRDVTRLHPIERLPREFSGLSNGHSGSHQFLVDDFVRACVEGTLPPNNVWAAARYAVPGIVAHESAMRGGELLEIPDFGDPPR